MDNLKINCDKSLSLSLSLNGKKNKHSNNWCVLSFSTLKFIFFYPLTWSYHFIETLSTKYNFLFILLLELI